VPIWNIRNCYLHPNQETWKYTESIRLMNIKYLLLSVILVLYVGISPCHALWQICSTQHRELFLCHSSMYYRFQARRKKGASKIRPPLGRGTGGSFPTKRCMMHLRKVWQWTRRRRTGTGWLASRFLALRPFSTNEFKIRNNLLSYETDVWNQWGMNLNMNLYCVNISVSLKQRSRNFKI